MKTSFLDYYKEILSKVSFDQELLRKEYTKALNILTQYEASELNRWVQERGLFLKMQSFNANVHSSLTRV